MSFAITTEAGLLEGVDPPNDLVRAIATRWPMGIEERVLNNEKCFAIFVEQGEQEVLGVKLQQPDCESEEDAYAWASIRGWQIARAAGAYLKLGYSGLMIAGVYYRAKEPTRYEAGIALFPVPQADGGEALASPESGSIDRQLGRGSREMVFGLVRAIADTKDDKLPHVKFIGTDVRRMSQMERVRLDFLLFQSHVFSLWDEILPEDPIWQRLVEGGVNQIFHMPSVRAAR